MKTKKVGSAGRFGSRYGTKTKKIINKIEKLYKKQVCPYCMNKSVKRVASGIFLCNKGSRSPVVCGRCGIMACRWFRLPHSN